MVGETLTQDEEEVTDETLYLSRGTVYGTLKYLSGYAGQSGNFIAIYCEANVPGTAITARISNTVTLVTSGIAVLRVSDKDSQTLTVVAKKNGYETVVKVFSLDGLICETE